MLLRRRLKSERARSEALESALRSSQVELEDRFQRMVWLHRGLGMLMCVVCVVLLRLVLGPRPPPPDEG